MTFTSTHRRALLNDLYAGYEAFDSGALTFADFINEVLNNPKHRIALQEYIANCEIVETENGQYYRGPEGILLS